MSKGIRGLITYAAEEYDFRPSKTRYVLKCEICDEARRFLVVDLGIHTKELQPDEYYLMD